MKSLALKMKKIMSISFFEEIFEFTKICQVGDYIDEKLVPPKIMTLTELNARYNMNLDF